MGLIKISVSDNWVVEYDRERGMYRASYFEDNHFVDECWFDAYEEKELTNKAELIAYLGTVRETGKSMLGDHRYLSGVLFEYLMDNLIIKVKELLA